MFQSYTNLIKINATILRSENDDFDQIKKCSFDELNSLLFCNGECFKSVKYVESHQITYEWCGNFEPTNDLIMGCNSIRECLIEHISQAVQNSLITIKYCLGVSTCSDFQEL